MAQDDGSIDDVAGVYVHDCFSIGGMLQMRQLGLLRDPEREFESGNPRALLRGKPGERFYSRNGKNPINPDGGLLYMGHPVGATGVIQIAHAVEQLLRRAGPYQIEDTSKGMMLTYNVGGLVTLPSVTVVGRPMRL